MTELYTPIPGKKGAEIETGTLGEGTEKIKLHLGANSIRE